MKKKSLADTYLRDVTDYNINIIDDVENDCYIAVKEIRSAGIPYAEGYSGNNRQLLDDGYYLVEYFTKNENYGVRVFLNDKKEIQEFYLDIIESVGVENDIPYYMDLYLDIIYQPVPTGEKKYLFVLDEDELIEALEEGLINQEQFELAYVVKDRVYNEISNGVNRIVNLNHVEMIDKVLGC